MNNKWEKTCDALKKLLEILSCSKCKKSLHEPQQFLNCGHFSCISCINNNNDTCIQCQLPCKNQDIIKDDTVDKIIKACCVIAEEVGFRQNVENKETRFHGMPLAEKTENISNISLDNLTLSTNNSNTPLNHSKSKKLKRNQNLNHKKHAKRIKVNENASTLRIPKAINKKNHHGETKLLEECKKGRIENVEKLLKAGADPNIPCYAGWTPLQESADYRFYEICKILLEAQASVNQVGIEGRTALHEAAKNNDIKLIELLLQYKADKNVIDKDGKRPVDCCKTKEIQILLSTENNVQYNEEEIKENRTNSKSSKNINCAKNLEETTCDNTFHNSNEKNIFNSVAKIEDVYDNDEEISIVYEGKKNDTINHLQESGSNIVKQESTSLNHDIKVDVKSPNPLQESINSVNKKENLDETEMDINYSQETYIDCINISNSQNFIHTNEYSYYDQNVIDKKSDIYIDLENTDCAFITESEEIIDVVT